MFAINSWCCSQAPAAPCSHSTWSFTRILQNDGWSCASGRGRDAAQNRNSPAGIPVREMMGRHPVTGHYWTAVSSVAPHCTVHWHCPPAAPAQLSPAARQPRSYQAFKSSLTPKVEFLTIIPLELLALCTRLIPPAAAAAVQTAALGQLLLILY